MNGLAWRPVKPTDPDYPAVTDRTAFIMRMMDGRYRALTGEAMRTWLVDAAHENELYYATDAKPTPCEIVLAFGRKINRPRYYVENVGFWGEQDADKVIDPVVAQIKWFADQRGQSVLYAIKPYTMDYLPNKQLIDRMAQHANVRATVENAWPDALYWRLEWVGP